MPKLAVAVAAAAVPAFLAGLVGTYALWGGSSPAVDEDPGRGTILDASGWNDRILSCLPPADNTPEQQAAFFEPAVEECLRGVYFTAAEAGQVNAIADATSEVIQDKVLLSMLCHDLAHDSGEMTLQFYKGDIVAAVNAYNGNGTCEGGFLHGITDAWAKGSPPDEEYQAVGEACKREQNGDFYGLCAHGYGHAAWIGRLDPLKAAGLCALLDRPDGRAQCGEGIIMDLYQPAGSNIEHRPLELAREEMPGLCQEWPRPDLEGMHDGCLSGAAYIFAREVFENMGSVDQFKPPFRDIPEEFYANTRAASSRAVGFCRGMQGESSKQCQKYLAKFVVWRPSPALAHPDVRAAICSGFDDDLQDMCLSLKFEIF